MGRRDFFDRRAPSWDSGRPRELEGRLRRVVAEAGVAEGDRVLDVGTGTGVLIPLIAGAVGREGRVLALDFSFSMLAQARDELDCPNVLLVQGDIHRAPVARGRFDRVICNAALPHFEDRGLALREMVGALRPGGVLVISHPVGREAANARHRRAGGPVGEDRVPPPEQMERLLREQGLEDIAVVDEPEFYLARGRRRP